MRYSVLIHLTRSVTGSPSIHRSPRRGRAGCNAGAVECRAGARPSPNPANTDAAAASMFSTGFKVNWTTRLAEVTDEQSNNTINWIVTFTPPKRHQRSWWTSSTRVHDDKRPLILDEAIARGNDLVSAPCLPPELDLRQKWCWELGGLGGRLPCGKDDDAAAS